MKMITNAIKARMDKTPLYSQDGKGDDALVLFKVFNPYGDGSWYVLEAGEETASGDRELYGWVVMHGEGEYGYFRLSDLTETKVKAFGVPMPLERDRFFEGTIADAKKDSHIA